MRNRVETGAWIAWIMAEIEPYSFEPMRDSSESDEDDVHKRQDERRRGNTSWKRPPFSFLCPYLTLREEL